ncbi:(2Fe-2S)-binding protein [Streptomyces sp. NPDC008001]|uniref:(2Fe-2S)-binding protein n=1 Tax=Streptomyces sp. NPDC008001 TaxID=3364804 RepID=UPI0036E02EA9
MTTAVATSRVVSVPGTATRADVLRETYARLGETLRPLVRLDAGPRAAGAPVTGERLVRDAGLREWLVDMAGRRMEDAHGVTPRRDVAALDALHQYAFLAALAMSGPWFLERRVPWVGPDGIGYDEASGSLTVSPSYITCLPDDPAAGLPGVRVVADEEQLRSVLRAAVAHHLGPVLEAFRPLLRRGPRAVWGLATDELTEGIWYVGRVTGEEGRAAAAADALLPGNTRPFVGAAGFRSCGDGDGGGGESGEVTRTRVNCCLWYTLSPQKLCATCPRTNRA